MASFDYYVVRTKAAGEEYGHTKSFRTREEAYDYARKRASIVTDVWGVTEEEVEEGLDPIPMETNLHDWRAGVSTSRHERVAKKKLDREHGAWAKQPDGSWDRVKSSGGRRRARTRDLVGPRLPDRSYYSAAGKPRRGTGHTHPPGPRRCPKCGV